MELWIRSQDRKILLKVETIKVVNNWFYLNDKYDIGFYKTNKRALEVLDEIQNHLLKMGNTEILTDKIGIMNEVKHYGIIYEMPEE